MSELIVDLNADLGESFGQWRLGDDDAMLAIVTSANVACGFHAGDPLTLRRTVAGRLVLGSGFDPRDLAAYAAGVLVALLGETLLVRARGRDGRSLPPPTT